MAARLTAEERIQRHLARVLMRLPDRWKILLSGKPQVSHDGDQLSPDLQLILSLRERRGVGGLCDIPPEQARERIRRDGLIHAMDRIEVGEVKDLSIEGPGGPIALRFYVPADSTPGPLLVFYHGGGFVLGDLETHDAPCRMICRDAGIRVLSVAYRLAPENPFPAALDDARAAFSWAVKNAGRLGTDPKRISVGGDSAGANLATVVAQITADEGGPRPAFQLLIYPVVDKRGDYPSRTAFAEGFFLTGRDIQTFGEYYIPRAAVLGVEPPESYSSPLLHEDLSGLPPALVVTASFDPLRDEGEAYARAMSAAGARCRLERRPGMIHGFINMIGISPACRRSFAEVIASLRDELERLRP